MRFRDSTFLSEPQRVGAEQKFGIRICRDTQPVDFEDGTHEVASLMVHGFQSQGLAVKLLDIDWVSQPGSSLNPNEIKVVWRDVLSHTWRVKHLPHIAKTTIEAGGHDADETVTLTTNPVQQIYLFFKDTAYGHISVVHPFVKFPIHHAQFTDNELTSIQARYGLNGLHVHIT